MNTLQWLANLVSFDTTSHKSNLPLIEVINDWFKKHDLVTHLTYDKERQKANLLATLPAYNGSISEGLLLSGHTDVVPVTGQDWATDPFVATRFEDKIYGRGTCDMKGFLAVMLALVPVLQRKPLSKPVHFAFSYDEETGCHGVPSLIKDMQHRGIQPAACIVGEPTSMMPVIAHKGIQVFRCKVRGHAIHSSLTPQGCNANEYAADLIHFIRQLANELRQQGPFDQHYDVPFTTISTNKIEGGIAANIIPEHCEFIFEFRHLPQVLPRTLIDKISIYIQETLLPAMKQEHSHADIQMENIAGIPSFSSTETTHITQLAYAISGQSAINKVAYATEAGLFQAAHIPTIVCGPGSIEQAHRPNEYVTLAQLEKCEIFLKQLTQVFCSDEMLTLFVR